MTRRLLALVSLAGMDGMRTVVFVTSVDVEVAGPDSGIDSDPGDGFLDLKTFFKIRFITMKINQRDDFLIM